MALGVGTALLISGGLQAAGGIASGVGQAAAARRQLEAQEKRLRDLEERKKAGELGLTEGERITMEQRFLAEQAGAQRELEATALQQAAARGMGGPVSGRDIFLQEVAQAKAERELRQQQNILMSEVEATKAAANQARLDDMQARADALEAQRAAGIAEAVSLGLVAAGQTAAQYATLEQEQRTARAQTLGRQELLRGTDLGTGRNFTMGARS